MSARETTPNKSDERWMRRALRLAERGAGRTRPNPPVGAVIVRRGREAGVGFHARAGGSHAEIVALTAAGTLARGATLYVTLEPCCTCGRTGPCTEAIRAAGIARVVIGARDPNPIHDGRGIRRLRRSGIRVDEGILAETARELIRPFESLVKRGRPFVTVKLGMTLDGRIADARHRSKWITSAASRKQVARMRSRADGILVGRQTVRDDDPGLLAPGRDGLWRIVADSRGRMPTNARVLSDSARARTLVATTARCPQAFRRLCAARGVRLEQIPARSGQVSLPALMRRLGKLGLTHVLCEGGGELAAALVAAGLADELVLFMAPSLLGGGATVPAIGGPGWPLRAMPRLRITEARRIGDDLMIRAVPAKKGDARG